MRDYVYAVKGFVVLLHCFLVNTELRAWSSPRSDDESLAIVSVFPKRIFDQVMSNQPAQTQTQRIATRPKHSSVGSTIPLFLANLRLLNLDLRNDWPEIATNDFDTKHAAQNQKRRISCVEWSLYRLFELYDSGVTKEVRASLRSLLFYRPVSTIYSPLCVRT